MRLTEKTIKELVPPAKGNRITYDDEVPGFGIRVTRLGARAFVLNYVVEGRERRLTIGAWPVWSATGARRRAKELRIRIDQGEDPLGESQGRRQEPTFAEVATEYLENHAAKKKSGHADKLYLDRDVLPSWGHLKAGDIRRRDVIRLGGGEGESYADRRESATSGSSESYLVGRWSGICLRRTPVWESERPPERTVAIES